MRYFQMKKFMHCYKNKQKAFFQLCIITLIGIIGITVSVEAIEIRHLKKEIEIIKQWME